MAAEKIAMGINLRQNKNKQNSGYGKYYPEVDVQKTLSLRGFAQHMTNHGSPYGRAIVEGVLMQITECLPELVAHDGKLMVQHSATRRIVEKIIILP